MNKNNITFDLETLGNSSNAPIVQIGAVKFDDNDVLSKFLVDIKLESLENYDFKLDYSTINWWMQQDPVAIHSVFGDHNNRVNITQALHDFHMWIGKPSEYVYWSHATFDPPILDNAFKKTGRTNPIPFKAHRDIRTLTYFTGVLDLKREGIHHNALDDAIFQSRYITKCLKLMQKEYKIWR